MKNILIDNVETKYFLEIFCIIHAAIGITFLKFYLVSSFSAGFKPPQDWFSSRK